jgi:hypothetical protein
MHTITVEEDLDFITVVLEGFWSQDDFNKFIDDQYAARKRLKCAAGQHVLLCDLTKLKVFTQDLANYIAPELNSKGTYDAEWMAIAVSSVLLKLQVQRILTRPNSQVFDDLNSARNWLLESSGRQSRI